MIESDQLYGKDIHHPKARGRPRCGARLRGDRAGLLCQRRVVQHRTSCPNHLGCCRPGMSKGPTTVEGRRRIAEAQKRRWIRWREAKAVGIPLPHERLGRPPKASAMPTRTEWVETPDQRRSRILRICGSDFPNVDFECSSRNRFDEAG
jgi:hypothetical protein